MYDLESAYTEGTRPKYQINYEGIWQQLQAQQLLPLRLIIFQNGRLLETGLMFDVCKCNIPCPCEFAQAPTYEDCDGVLAYHIKKGNYGDISLDDLNVLALGSFEGNI